MSRIGNARKLIKKAFDTAEKLSAANWNKWREQDFRGYQLAVMITSGTVTGVGPGAIEYLEKLVDLAEQLLVREQADIALAKGAQEDSLMKFLEEKQGKPHFVAQYRADAISEFGNVGTRQWLALDAAKKLSNLLVGHKMLPVIETEEKTVMAVFWQLADGETLEDEHGAAFRVVRVGGEVTSRPVKYRAQHRTDPASAFGTVGSNCVRPQDAAYFLHALMGLAGFAETDFPQLDQRMADGETVEIEDGPAFRVLKV